jgi:phosphohistidine swiveling domain-containing protein
MSDDRKRYNSEICYYLNGVIFPNLAKKLGITREEALYVDHEFLSLFEKDSITFRKRLNKRTEMLVEITEDGVYSWYEGKEECQMLLDSLDIHLKVDDNIREIKGQVAFKGKVIGKVRILKTSHVDDFEEGDIIVTGMTTPDFAPLMKKASAIVTNEGGITCHAAIVSRELKIPCVIGTKIATQVFKDGDMVEVDADRGIVKIIK